MDTGKSFPEIENMLVGDEPCSYGVICDVLSHCKSAGIIWSKLVDVARRLGLPEDAVILIGPRLLIGTKTHPTVLHEVLEGWRGKEGKNAKLTRFLSFLEEEGLIDGADALRQYFNTLAGFPYSTTWDDLSDSQKLEISDKLVLFQGKPIKLGNFSNLNDLDGNILDKLARGETPELVNAETTQKLDYYISRKIKKRSRLLSNVFQSKCNDVFVVQGIERQQLTKLADDYSTDVSGNQIRRLTVRFILLEYEPDYEKICKLSEHPVHLIKVDGDSYHWVMSSGPTKALQQYVEKNQDLITEKEMVACANKVNLLTDSPGMGKTILLWKLIEESKRIEPTTLVHYIVLKEIVQALENKEINIDAIASWIAEQVSAFEYGRKLVKTAIISEKSILMLDGYDEVLSHQQHSANQILQELSNLKSTQIFVATRPHMQEELENAIHVLSYTIEPFCESDQLSFLTKFWSSKGITVNESVEEFAKSCVRGVSASMTDLDRQITGIPLQCKILAETYEEDAERCSNLGHEKYELPLSRSLPTSVFQMYEAHIAMRFNQLGNETNYESIKQEHMYLALELLFPEDVTLLKSDSPISLRDLCRCGIVEMSELGHIRFVHRTFAEYLVAMFVVDDASKCLGEFKLRQIFTTTSRPNDSIKIPFFYEMFAFPKWVVPAEDFCTSEKSFQFNFPVVNYFINEFRKKCSDSKLSGIASMLYSNVYKEIDSIVFASAFHNYPYVIQEACDLLDGKISTDNFDNSDIGELLVTTAMHSDIELMQAICQDAVVPQIPFPGSTTKIDRNRDVELVETLFQEMSIQKLHFPKGETKNGTEFLITPLHVSIQKGNYNLVEFLVSKFGDSLTEQRYLLHFCVANSLDDNTATLNSKKQIIKLLTSKSNQWLHERISNCTPLLQSKVNIELMNCLIEQGADVNAVNNFQETVLHKLFENEVSPDHYHQIVVSCADRGYKHFNLRDSVLRTPILWAVRNVEVLDVTVKLLHSKGADFNAVDNFHYSVLWTAIDEKKSVRLIKQLIKHGADFHLKDPSGNGVLHFCTHIGHSDAILFFLQVHHMDVNVTNDSLDTPLHLAVYEVTEFQEEGIVRLLITNGANVNAKNSNSRTPILEAFRLHGLSLPTIQLMEQHGLKGGKKKYSNLLKTAMWNKELQVNFAATLVHLIEKGGRLGGKKKGNPWKFQSVQNILHEVVEATSITPELLLDAEKHKLLRKREVREIQQTEDARKSDKFYKIVVEKMEMFETVLKILLWTNQTDSVFKVKLALIDHFYENETDNFLRPAWIHINF